VLVRNNVIRALTFIIAVLLCPIYSSNLDTPSTSILIGDFQDREFTQKYVGVVNIGTGKGVGVKNNRAQTITIRIEYGIWTFQQPLMSSERTIVTLPAGKAAAIIDSRIKIENIRSILRLWVNERLIINKTREDTHDNDPILLFQYSESSANAPCLVTPAEYLCT